MATLHCKSLDDIIDAQELAAALKQELCEVDAPRASIPLRKGLADSDDQALSRGSEQGDYCRLETSTSRRTWMSQM